MSREFATWFDTHKEFLELFSIAKMTTHFRPPTMEQVVKTLDVHLLFPWVKTVAAEKAFTLNTTACHTSKLSKQLNTRKHVNNRIDSYGL